MYDCILKLNTNKIVDYSFEKETDYYDFLFATRNEVIWAKLINKITGEIVDEYVHLSNLSPEILNIQISKSDFKDTTTAILLTRQKMYWFMNLIRKHSTTTSEYLMNNQLNFLTVTPKKTRVEGFYVPTDLVLVSKEELLVVLRKLVEEFDNNNYKKRLLRHFIDLEGSEISLNKALPKD